MICEQQRNMAMMTLRVGNRQGARPAILHNERKEMNILTIPENILQEARRISTLENHSLGETVEKLSSASSIEEQLSTLKKLVNNHLEARTVDTETSDFCIRLLTDLYFESTPKNPLKCAIARMLVSFPEKAHGCVASCLSSKLEKLLTSDGNSSNLNSLMVAINCCFDNFSLGVTAVSLTVMPVLEFINASLKLYLVELSEDVSPAKKMEICQMLHNVVRGAVSLLQKCQAQVRQLVCSETNQEEDAPFPDVVTKLADLLTKCRIADSSNLVCHQEDINTESCPAVSTLNSILQLIKSLMSYPDLPMDTHTNCGMVFVLLTLLLRKYNVEWSKDVNNLQLTWEVDMNTDNCQMAVCMGLLNALTPVELSQRHPEAEEPLINFIFHKLMQISERTTADSGMVLGVSRALLLLSRTALSLPDISIVKTIVQEMMVFVYIHLEHYMDSVRHNVSGVLQNFAKLALADEQANEYGSNIVHIVFTAVTCTPRYRKSFCIGLGIVADVLGFQFFMECIPHFVLDLLEDFSQHGFSTHAISLLERLMLRHATEVPESEWREVWVTPILEMLSEAPPTIRGPLQTLLAVAVKHNPSLVSDILQMPNNSKIQLHALLSCICLARKQGALDTDVKLSHSTESWKGILDLKVLEQAVCHRDVETRMSALSLLAESHRSTETFSVSELQLIKTFLVYNINTEIPSSRQQTIALLKKILTRLRDSSQAVHRKMVQNKARKKETDIDSIGNSILRSYNTFLLWLLDFCFSNLFPGANFGRRGSSLQILTLCHEILTFDPNQPVWTPCSPDVWTPSNANVLLECLKDTYENNKIFALNLLVAFPAEALGLMEPSYVQSLVEVCLSLASSHRPPDCITAAYLMHVLVAFEQTNLALEAISCKQGKVAVNYTMYLAIQVLLSRLTAELDQANRSFLVAASSGPMYGSLFCIRHLLKDVDLKCIAEDSCWRSLIADIVNICFRLNEVVGPVVNSSSPEGHLPMDFQAGNNHLEQGTDGPATPVLNVTAQMVLLCSWRTVKEVSLFLGELAERAPISCDLEAEQEKGLLTEREVLAIGAHLATLLAETKHRGAFEQAYVGFCALCSRLWRHPSARLHRLPQQWLNQIMEAITWGRGSKLCATRRSAGLPFMVQALVTTELQVGSNSSCFQKSMVTLLNLADITSNCNRNEESSNVGSELEKKVPETSSSVDNEEFSILGLSEASGEGVSVIEARTHALNILRSLFRHSLLGELVTPYVAQGVIVAIRGFKGKTWGERNSATLLFSALVTRIFGVCRSKDTLSIRNRMTGRIFFQRYPALYDFLLEELKEAVTSMEECHSMLRPALFPILLLLARLYPSSLEGTDSNLQLSMYGPYVHRCALSSVFKTRELAAEALIPLIAPSQYVALLDELITIVAQTSIIENYRHGLLLQIHHILEEAITLEDVKNEVFEKIDGWISSLVWLLKSEHVCLMSSKVFLHIIVMPLKYMFNAFNPALWQDVYQILHSIIFTSQELPPSRLIGREIFLYYAAQLMLLISLTSCERDESLSTSTVDIPSDQFRKDTEELIVNMLHHPNYQVVNVGLLFIESLVNEGKFLSQDDEDSTLPVDEYFCDKVHEWNRTHGGVLADKFRTSAAIGEFLVKQVLVEKQFKYQECYQRMFLVISRCPKLLLGSEVESEKILRSLLRQCHEVYETTGWTILMCVGALTNAMLQENVTPSAEVGSELCQALVTFSSMEKSVTCRITVADILLKNTAWLKGNTPFLSVLDLCKLWSVVMTLLDDDSAHVRELISELVTLLDCTTVPVVSQRARELLLDYFTTMMVNLDPLMCCVCLVVWCVGSSDSDSGEEPTEDRVFDKGEMNIFAEAATLTDLVSGYLKKLLCRENRYQLFKTSLGSDVKLWISQMMWPDSDAAAVAEECSSLVDFVKKVERSATLPCSTSHFLLLSQKSGFLTLYRTRKLVEAISGAMADE